MLRHEKGLLIEDISRQICAEDISLLIIKNNDVPASVASVVRDLIFSRQLGGMFAIKNKILNIVLQKSGFGELQDLYGSHFLFYTKDIVALAKLIDAFFKSDFLKEKIEFLHGYDEKKKILAKEAIQDIIVLPSKEVILGKITFSLRRPLMGITGVRFALMRIAFCMNNFNK